MAEEIGVLTLGCVMLSLKFALQIKKIRNLIHLIAGNRIVPKKMPFGSMKQTECGMMHLNSFVRV